MKSPRTSSGAARLARRRAGQSEAMTAGAILQPQDDVLERQLRRAAQLVSPGDERVADDDARLAQHPVDDPLLAGLFAEIQRHARRRAACRRRRGERSAAAGRSTAASGATRKTAANPRRRSVACRAGSRSRHWHPARVMRRLPMSRRGFQPSQPVATDPISTGWPICAASRCATASGLLSTRGKMTKRTASSIRHTATRTIKTIVRAAQSVLRNESGKAGRKLEDARAKGIIGRSGAILIRKGAAAALNSRMDLAGAYEFSRYAQRLRVADPGLCACRRGHARPAFPMAGRRARRARPRIRSRGAGRCPAPAAPARIPARPAARPDRTRRSGRSLRDDDAAGRERDRARRSTRIRLRSRRSTASRSARTAARPSS